MTEMRKINDNIKLNMEELEKINGGDGFKRNEIILSLKLALKGTIESIPECDQKNLY